MFYLCTMNLKDFQFEDSIPGWDALRRNDGNINAWDIYSPKMRNTHIKDLIWGKLFDANLGYAYQCMHLSKKNGFSIDVFAGHKLPTEELRTKITQLVIDAVDNIPNWYIYVPKITVVFGQPDFNNRYWLTTDEGLNEVYL